MDKTLLLKENDMNDQQHINNYVDFLKNYYLEKVAK